MAIPRKQIGWSQESNLLWEISRQMEKLTGVAYNSGGGGGGVTSITAGNGISVDVPTGNVTVSTSTNFQIIDLSLGDYDVSTPGVYDIVNPDGGYEIIISCSPATYTGQTITFINKGNTAAPISIAEWLPYYQGNFAANTINRINAGATVEIVAVYDAINDNGWRTKSTTFVQTQEDIILTDGLNAYNLSVAIDGGGFYVITVANNGLGGGGQIFFPPAPSYIGQRVVILNLDTSYNAVISNNGYAPIELDSSIVNYVPASSAMEFISTGTYWYVLSTRTV